MIRDNVGRGRPQGGFRGPIRHANAGLSPLVGGGDMGGGGDNISQDTPMGPMGGGQFGPRPQAYRQLQQDYQPGMAGRFMQAARQGTFGSEAVTGPGGSTYTNPGGAAGDALQQVQERFQPVRDARTALMDARGAMQNAREPGQGVSGDAWGEMRQARREARQGLPGARQEARVPPGRKMGRR